MADILVIDTSVLLHDPLAVYRLHAATLVIPAQVINELHELAAGTTEFAKNAREAARTIELSITQHPTQPNDAQSLDATQPAGNTSLVIVDVTDTKSAFSASDTTRAVQTPHAAIQSALRLLKDNTESVVKIISRDATTRILARALSLVAQDYSQYSLTQSDAPFTFEQTVRRLSPTQCDLLKQALPVENVRQTQIVSKEILNALESSDSVSNLPGSKLPGLILPGQILVDDTNKLPLAFCVGAEKDADEPEDPGVTNHPLVLRSWHGLIDESGVWGITARNAAQAAALGALLDTETDLVTIEGEAGTGKTLLALACGLHQTLDCEYYDDVIVTRATVSIGEDIGFLPGTEEEKMNPWMGAIHDNLDILMPTEQSTQADAGANKNVFKSSDWSKSAGLALIQRRIKIRSMNFMRGRTFTRKYIIIDEAQNLTPHQLRMLVTRVGAESKIVCLGNMAQIDTPWLTEDACGLTWVRGQFRHFPHYADIVLQEVERSRLAKRAAQS